MTDSHRYKWSATLDDGLVIKQEDKLVGYEELPHSRVRTFELLKDGITKLKINIRPGERFVWRRRTEMAPGRAVMEVCHILAKKVNGKWNTIGIFESDGHTEFVEDFLPTSKWFSKPNLREFEK